MVKFTSLFEQFLRLLQLVGIPLMGSLFLIGLLLLLTSGKNPKRKRAGFVMTIFFFFGTLAVAYVPALVYTYQNETPLYVAEHKTVNDMVGGSTTIGNSLFKAIWYLAVPVCATIAYIGLVIRFETAKNPQRARIALGLIMFSPLVLGVAYFVPSLLSHL
jgi:hypothetical protein